MGCSVEKMQNSLQPDEMLDELRLEYDLSNLRVRKMGPKRKIADKPAVEPNSGEEFLTRS